jgi:hypothetical protein
MSGKVITQDFYTIDSQYPQTVVVAIEPVPEQPKPKLRGWQRVYNNHNICPCHGMTNCQDMD